MLRRLRELQQATGPAVSAGRLRAVGAGAIDLGILRKVSRRFRQISRHHVDELFFRHRLQRVIEFSLLADRRRSFGGKILAAHRAGAVGRIDLDRIVQLQQLFVQAVVHHRGHRLRRVALAARKIGPADVADEQACRRSEAFCGRRHPCRHLL